MLEKNDKLPSRGDNMINLMCLLYHSPLLGKFCRISGHKLRVRDLFALIAKCYYKLHPNTGRRQCRITRPLSHRDAIWYRYILLRLQIESVATRALYVMGVVGKHTEPGNLFCAVSDFQLRPRRWGDHKIYEGIYWKPDKLQ